MFINEYGDKKDPHILIVIRHGFQHCGYMAANPKEYAEEIEAFIWRNRNVLG